MNQMTDEEIANMEALPMQQEVEARAKGPFNSRRGLKGHGYHGKTYSNEWRKRAIFSKIQTILYFNQDEEDILDEDIGITNKDMVDLEHAWKMAQTAQERPRGTR